MKAIKLFLLVILCVPAHGSLPFPSPWLGDPVCAETIARYQENYTSLYHLDGNYELKQTPPHPDLLKAIEMVRATGKSNPTAYDLAASSGSDALALLRAGFTVEILSPDPIHTALLDNDLITDRPYDSKFWLQDFPLIAKESPAHILKADLVNLSDSLSYAPLPFYTHRRLDWLEKHTNDGALIVVRLFGPGDFRYRPLVTPLSNDAWRDDTRLELIFSREEIGIERGEYGEDFEPKHVYSMIFKKLSSAEIR